MTSRIYPDSLGEGSAVLMPLTLQPSGSCPLPPDPLIFFFFKRNFGHEGVLLGCSLAGFVVCGFASVAWLGILPKVACHGDDGR